MQVEPFLSDLFSLWVRPVLTLLRRLAGYSNGGSRSGLVIYAAGFSVGRQRPVVTYIPYRVYAAQVQMSEYPLILVLVAS